MWLQQNQMKLKDLVLADLFTTKWFLFSLNFGKLDSNVTVWKAEEFNITHYMYVWRI